jgi:hypothetical protein
MYVYNEQYGETLELRLQGKMATATDVSVNKTLTFTSFGRKRMLLARRMQTIGFSL